MTDLPDFDSILEIIKFSKFQHTLPIHTHIAAMVPQQLSAPTHMEVILTQPDTQHTHMEDTLAAYTEDFTKYLFGKMIHNLPLRRKSAKCT